MKFSIITPTHKRKEGLAQAVQSVLAQTYRNWELIIVNDSPHDQSYQGFAATINDPRIRYYVNEYNHGVNFTRNFAIEQVSADSRWIIFLDDDDYLSPDTLATFVSLIQNHPEQKWFVTNRALINGEPLTKFPKDEHYYNYAWDYLILKRCKGDATHCIETKTILQKRIHFLKHVKQGEEWFFFFQLGRLSHFFYFDHNSTISIGYDETGGLNYRKRNLASLYKDVSTILYEGSAIGLTWAPSFLIYILIRLIKPIFLIFKRS